MYKVYNIRENRLMKRQDYETDCNVFIVLLYFIHLIFFVRFHKKIYTFYLGF
jgi:hypothetical protein